MRYGNCIFLFVFVILVSVSFVYADSDLNNDYRIDDFDRVQLISALDNFSVGSNGCLPSNMFCDWADVNRDGAVGINDLEEFITEHLSSCINYDLEYYVAINDGLISGVYNDVTCDSSNNLCDLFDVNLDGSLTTLDNDTYNSLLDNCVVTSMCIEVDNDAVSHYKFDGDLIDSKDVNNGIDKGSIQYIEGKGGMAAKFDNTDYINIGDKDIGQAEFSVSGLIKFDSFTQWQTIVGRASDTSWANGWGLFYDASSSSLRFFVGNYNINFVASDIVKNVDTWYHVTGTYDGSSIRLYVDGGDVGRYDISMAVPSTGDINIGGFLGGYTDGIGYHQGSIDDLKIFDYALTPNQILEDYNTCFTNQCGDGIDNDKDGDIDSLILGGDTGCTNLICSLGNVTVQFEGSQGPWEHVGAPGDAKAPTLAMSGLNAGETVTAESITGKFSGRISHGIDYLPIACDGGSYPRVPNDVGEDDYAAYGTFTDDNNARVSRHMLSDFKSGIVVPDGATKLYVHVLDAEAADGRTAYFDNSGNRDNREPCEVTFELIDDTLVDSGFLCYDYIEGDEDDPQCADGFDNDNDGLVDFQDPDCWANVTDSSSYLPNDGVEAPAAECGDGQNNDDDDLIDVLDLDCLDGDGNYVPEDFKEASGPECDDGQDNDDDGFADNEDSDCWLNPNDPGSYDPTHGDESVPPGSVGGTFWSDMTGSSINKSSLNALVRLTVEGAGLQGRSIEYKIIKRNGDGFLDWFLPDSTAVAGSQTEGFLIWRAGKKDDGKKDDGIKEEGFYYFKAKLEGTNEWKSTLDNPDEDLKYLQVRGPEVNSPPVANITGPIDKQIYFLNEIINFTQNSYDLDDNFDFVWDLNGEENRVGDSVSGDNYEFTHSFDSTGQKNIILTVTDDRGETDRDQISILIINSSFILAYIDEPMFGEAFGREVTFDASSTYAIDETIDDVTGDRTIECIAGMCPSQTEGCPPGHDNSPGCHLDIEHAPTTVAEANYDDVTFTWVFDGDVSNSFIGIGNSGVSFTKIFPSIGRHSTSLTTSINPTSSSSTEFDIFFDTATCVVVDDQIASFFPDSYLGQSYWIDQDSTKSSQLDCFREEGVSSDGQLQTECCPVGYSCNVDSNRCEFTGVTRCGDLAINDCSNHGEIASSELDALLEDEFALGCDFGELYGDHCQEFVDCFCEWDSVDSKCDAVSSHKVQDLRDSTPPIMTWDYDYVYVKDNLDEIQDICNYGGDELMNGRCVFTFDYEGDCNAGSEFIVREWNVSWDGDEILKPNYCQPDSDTLSCGNVVKLGFFGLFNLIVSVLALIGVYLVLSRRRD